MDRRLERVYNRMFHQMDVNRRGETERRSRRFLAGTIGFDPSLDIDAEAVKAQRYLRIQPSV